MSSRFLTVQFITNIGVTKEILHKPQLSLNTDTGHTIELI